MGLQGILEYPAGAEFAFTILDDTDDTTVANGRPVYDLLREVGMRTTKTVWAFDTPPENRGPYFAGETLSSSDYLRWIHELSASGFEIALHNATMGSSVRQDTLRAFDIIENEFGQPVRLHCNHGQNLENLYWGADRYRSPTIMKALGLLASFRAQTTYEGNNPESPYYWSDIAAERLSYMRAFAFRRLNGFQIPPGRPYREPLKQGNPVFFNTTDAPDVRFFNRLITPTAIDRLREQKGWAIISTHFGKGFYWKNRLNPEFRGTIEYLASLPGWFVPVSQLLDLLSEKLGANPLSDFERSRMEYAHIADRVQGKIFNPYHSDYWQMDSDSA
jgi:peptidoglycan/xylan/chitin deacetylase (PgdA/CDA1 family)